MEVKSNEAPDKATNVVIDLLTTTWPLGGPETGMAKEVDD